MKEKKFSVDDALKNVSSLAEQTSSKTDWKYVKRPYGQIERAVQILHGKSSQQKFLLAGQDGCGKTTELNRLEELTSEQYSVMRCDHRHFHDLNHTADIEFLFVLLRAIFSAAETKSKAVQDQIVESIGKIFGPAKIGDFDAKSSILGITLRSKIVPRNEDIRKEIFIRNEFRMFRSELNSSIHNAIDIMQQHEGKPLLLIVDDLEKFEYDKVSQLMIENYQILSSFPCAVVYTVPLWLLFSEKLPLLGERFNIINLANVPLINKRDENIKNGWQFFEEIAAIRLKSLWTDMDAAVRKAISFASGGNIRQFLSILCSLLLDAGKSSSKKIEKEHVKQNFMQIAAGFRRILNQEDRLILEDVRQTREFNYSLPSRLLTNFSVLEYWSSDSGTWYDVSPLILPNHPCNPIKLLSSEKDITNA